MIILILQVTIKILIKILLIPIFIIFFLLSGILGLLGSFINVVLGLSAILSGIVLIYGVYAFFNHKIDLVTFSGGLFLPVIVIIGITAVELVPTFFESTYTLIINILKYS